MPLLRRYRLLLIVVGLTAFSLWWESTDQKSGRASAAGGGGPAFDAYTISRAFEKLRMSEVFSTLYPDRPETLLERGLRAERAGDNETARKIFEQAIRTGIKTSEDLYYDYVLVLVRLKAPQSEIDAAAENWRRLFPLTKLSDPRTLKDDQPSGQSRKKMWAGE